jgi:hypothetical protein
VPITSLALQDRLRSNSAYLLFYERSATSSLGLQQPQQQQQQQQQQQSDRGSVMAQESSDKALAAGGSNRTGSGSGSSSNIAAAAAATEEPDTLDIARGVDARVSSSLIDTMYYYRTFVLVRGDSDVSRKECATAVC